MIYPQWPAPANVKSVTFCRPDQVNIDNISESKLVNLPQTLNRLNQVHSNKAVEISLDNIQNNLPADASYTSDRNVGCVIRTADCLPILVTSKDGEWVSAIHAGWRGLVSGVIENTLVNYSNNAHNLMAWVGPAISQRHFEVGQDVYDAFVEANTDDCIAFKASEQNHDKYYANLFLLAELRLKRLGVQDIYHSHQCTYSNPELYYSYRRDNGSADRLITVIWRT